MRWSTSTAMPVASMSASTKVSGSSRSVEQGRAAAGGQLGVEGVGQVADRRGPDRLGLGPGVVGLLQAAVQGELAGRRVGLVAQLALEVAQRQVGQVEGPLARLHQVGGQLGVRADPGQRPALLGQRQHRALDVVAGLGRVRVGQPAGQRLVVGGAQLGDVDPAGGAVGAGQRHRVQGAGAAAPGAGEGHPHPAAVGGVLGQEAGHLVRIEPQHVDLEALRRLRLGRGQGGEQPLAQHPELQVVEQLVHLVAVPLLAAELADAEVEVEVAHQPGQLGVAQHRAEVLAQRVADLALDLVDPLAPAAPASRSPGSTWRRSSPPPRRCRAGCRWGHRAARRSPGTGPGSGRTWPAPPPG